MNIFKKYIIPLKNFLFLWFGQSFSQIGSTMTGFAIAIWAFEKTGSALVLAISGFFIMVPDMVFGIIAGPLVDRANKKTVMILTDIGTGICTLILFLLFNNESMEVWHIYIINVVRSILNSFKSLASDVAVSAIVPKAYYVKASGLQSFSDGVMQIIAPVFAAVLLSIVGITGIIIFDLSSLVFACMTLVFVKIPASEPRKRQAFDMKQYFINLKQGYEAIKASNLLRKLLSFMVFVNLLAGITYYSLLTPMILARTANDYQVLLFVNGAVGFGGMAGALLVLFIPSGNRKTRTIFICLALSFLLGDILLSIGNTLYMCLYSTRYNASLPFSRFQIFQKYDRCFPAWMILDI